MTVTLFTLDGTRMETDRVLEASADWQAGSPAAQFSAVLPGENWPEELVTVRWKDDSGFTLFEGYLDTAAQVLDSDGPRLEVTARSAGCYLLDNEALPQSYDSVTLDSFCQRYLDSYGIFRRGFSYRGRIPYTVPKGQSEWEALAGFVYALTGKFPYLAGRGSSVCCPGTELPYSSPTPAPGECGFSPGHSPSAGASPSPRCWSGIRTAITPLSSATAGRWSWASAASAT